MGGAGYRLVSKLPGSTLELDRKNVFVMHACQLSKCSLCMHFDIHCYRCVIMKRFIMLMLR